MRFWKKIIASPELSILDVMKIINTETSQFAIIADQNNKLLGTITDGDIRRAILNGIDLKESCAKAMNPTPTQCSESLSEEEVFLLLKQKNITHIPIVNKDLIIVDVKSLSELNSFSLKKENPILIMAGGLGSRLGELTANCPKPLLKVGQKPILEIIIENFKAQGFRNFYISVNYKSEMIEEYFRNGEKLGIKIQYLREDKKLGTAGALSLIKEEISHPIIVMNGDLLTTINFNELLGYHGHSENQATMCIRRYEFQVPFGVINTEGDRIIKIDEKPIQQFFVNAGIYVLDPSILKLIPLDIAYDMPSLFNDIINLSHKTGVFPIHEYWLDIGQKDDLERAQFDVIKLY